MPAIISQDPAHAAAYLRSGALVALPTETVYGLGANALDEAAVAKIFSAKNRPSFDPLIIHQSSAERIFAYATSVPPAAQRLAEACWPGPLTMVLPKKREVPDLVSAGLPTVALRVPSHPDTLEVLRQVDFPVAAPSANPFGFVSPTTAQHVADQLADKIDLILDGGPCRVGLESTIVRFAEGQTTVLRKGGLPLEKLEEVLGHAVVVRTHGSSRPEAPGMLSRHYSPGNKLELFPTYLPDHPLPPHSAWIIFGHGGPSIQTSANGHITIYDLSPQANFEQAAQQLFSILRLMAAKGYQQVAVEMLPEEGLGQAINDRLRRASAKE
ncbi:MAG: L-threonylcarbamoyladenylate synthase [Bacteroidota bacterium]